MADVSRHPTSAAAQAAQREWLEGGGPGRGLRVAPRWLGVLALVCWGAGALPAAGQTSPAPQADSLTLVASQHRRLTFSANLERIAVGDATIAEGQLISNREVLLLGVAPGRTTVIVWFTNGTVRTYAVSVQRDLTLLVSALHRLHPAIEIESAPDRDAVVLTGTVPDVVVSQTAESMAREYLGALAGRQTSAARPLIREANPPVAPPADAAGDQAAQAPDAPAAPAAQLAAPVVPVAAVINLLRLEVLPPLPEERIRQAIQDLGGAGVRVRRVQRGPVRDDARDVFVLEGEVATQVALVRVLRLAAQIVAPRAGALDDVRVVADEAGALAGARLQDSGAQSGLGLSGLSTGGSGGGTGSRTNSRLSNQVERNIARAKVLEAADGRLVSVIDVRDVPQVRVDIRLFEINRSRLRLYTPQALAALSTRALPGLASTLGAGATPELLQGNVAQQIVGFLDGQFQSETQLVSRHAAVDAALAALEREGIARRLSSPSLTVLSGEQAQFHVGGELPVAVAFASAFSTNVQSQASSVATSSTVPGLFNAVEFVPFGVQLDVRPLVDEADVITLDVRPQIRNPSTDLTAAIRTATGASQQTVAFESRGLRTSARLLDGQSLVMGGLLSRSQATNTQGTPGLSKVPGLRWLFKGFDESEQAVDLVVVVTPSLLRDPVRDLDLWVFPAAGELLDSIGKAVHSVGGGG